MKLYVSDEGDMSVGIPSANITIDFGDWDLFSKKDTERRKAFKEAVCKLLYEHLDLIEPMISFFDDECPECECVKDDLHRCSNPCCIDSLEDFDVDEDGEIVDNRAAAIEQDGAEELAFQKRGEVPEVEIDEAESID